MVRSCATATTDEPGSRAAPLAAEIVGSALGFVTHRVKGDLERFKASIELKQRATGAWRGEIQGATVEKA